MSRFNGYWLAETRQKFRNDPEISAMLSSGFGIPDTNDFIGLGRRYRRSNHKPDKLYSTLPTIIKLAGNLEGKEVLDLGCGSGFFTIPLARLGALSVVGIDNSPAQLDLTIRSKAPKSVRWLLADIFADALPRADIIIAPYVVNYARDTEMLADLFQKFSGCTAINGRVILILDTPSGKNLQRYGARKIPLGPAKDGTRIQIDLFEDSSKPICRLHSTYFRQDTVSKLLRKAGFKRVKWHRPIVSSLGYKKLGSEYWKGYISNPELGYVTAYK